MFVSGILLIIVLGVLVLLSIIFWVEVHDDFDYILKITYKQFVSMYAINPKAWEMADNLYCKIYLS